MARKKRIVISGYYGFDNTGDEAVLYSILGALEQECKNQALDITVLSNQPEKTNQLYGVKAINRWDIKEIYRSIRSCDLLISGGGSLLQDVTSNKTVPYYLLIIKMAQWHKKDVLFYSQGYGPVNKSYNKYLISKVLNKTNHIFVRDDHSKEALLEIGVTKAPIKVVADPVLGMTANQETILKMKNYVESYSKGKLRVGIYLRSWKNDHRLVEKMGILCEILDQKGLDIFFVPMQHPEDCDFLEKLDFPRLSTHRIKDDLTIQENFALTGQMDIVIGMRLHALIMATAQGVPIVGISYDPKVEDFMKMLDHKDCFDVETFDPEELANSVVAQITNIEKEKEDMRYKKQLLIDKVYQPAKQINQILTLGGLK